MFAKPTTIKFIISVCLLFIFNSCTPRKEKPGSSTSATIAGPAEKNNELVRRIYYDMAAKQNFTLIDSFFAANIFDHAGKRINEGDTVL